MKAPSIQQRFREVARARSIKTARLRLAIEANIRGDLAPEEQDRLRRLVLDMVEQGTVTLEPSPREAHHAK